MNEPEPNLVVSSLSRRVTWEGHALRIEIYRLEDDSGWTLEVVNEAGTSIVWDDPFPSDRDADSAFRDTLAREGLAGFLDDGNVIPFPGRRH
jgi:uncharacterized protein